jgi:DNA-binding NtrC family response regulator
MQIERILVVDDDPGLTALLRNFLSESVQSVECVATLGAARIALAKNGFDLVVCDVRLPDGNGVELLCETRTQKSPPIFIMMSGYATIENATEAMRQGAADYLVKPFQPDQLELAVQRLEHWRRIENENAYLRHEIDFEATGEVLGESDSMKAVRRLIVRVAPSDATVLIHGESGTGKELVAHALHKASLRKDKPFIRLNCAAIPENLMESELFGHERGAFTGAHAKRAGRFELAHGGTLLLDEISEIPISLQAKLLRVIQEREFERVGGSHTLRVDVRLLATTNRDLEAHIKRGTFREDLYYRINVVPIHLPPLRQHPEDIERLLNHFLRHFSNHHGKPLPEVTPSARESLQGSLWPGNVRELQNCAERAILLAEPGCPLDPEDFGSFLPPHTTPLAPPPSAAASILPEDLSVSGMEKRLIRAALDRTGGKRAEAARILGISLRTLQYKIRDGLNS